MDYKFHACSICSIALWRLCIKSFMRAEPGRAEDVSASGSFVRRLLSLPRELAFDDSMIDTSHPSLHEHSGGHGAHACGGHRSSFPPLAPAECHRQELGAAIVVSILVGDQLRL